MLDIAGSFFGKASLLGIDAGEFQSFEHSRVIWGKTSTTPVDVALPSGCWQ